MEPRLPAGDPPEGVREARLPVAKRLDLRSPQDEARLELFEHLVVVPGLPVAGDDPDSIAVAQGSLPGRLAVRVSGFLVGFRRFARHRRSDPSPDSSAAIHLPACPPNRHRRRASSPSASAARYATLDSATRASRSERACRAASFPALIASPAFFWRSATFLAEGADPGSPSVRACGRSGPLSASLKSVSRSPAPSLSRRAPSLQVGLRLASRLRRQKERDARAHQGAADEGDGPGSPALHDHVWLLILLRHVAHSPAGAPANPVGGGPAALSGPRPLRPGGTPPDPTRDARRHPRSRCPR